MVQQIGLSKVMKKQIVKARSFAEAFDKCPWASEVSKVRGGYMCIAPAITQQVLKN